MKITNKHGLPDPFYRAIVKHQEEYAASHTKHSDISVTTLIGPPQIDVLKRKHDADLEEDVSDMIFAMDGHSIHKILEEGAGPEDSVEVRLYGKVGGWVVSGQYDHYSASESHLQDYKNVFVKEYTYGIKKERIAQLNCLAELGRMNGMEIERLTAFCKFRDWSKVRAAHDPSYPQKGFFIAEVEMWAENKAYQYMIDRIDLHQTARAGATVYCTDEERWHKPDIYAVMKESKKKALRLRDSHADAEVWCVDNGHGGRMEDGTFIPKVGIDIVHRPGEDTRCEHYCVVRDVCPQYKENHE